MNTTTTAQAADLDVIAVTVAGEIVRTYTRLHDAKAKADKIARESGVEVEVAQGGVVVHLTSPRAILKREEGVHYGPWTRLQDMKFQAPDVSGFYPAYQRVRVEATVYRAYDAEAEQPWLVHDGRTGGRVLCRTTKEACKVTSEMRQGRML